VSSARRICELDRAKRLNFQTATTANRGLWALAMRRSNSGRLSFAPEVPASTCSPVVCQARRSQEFGRFTTCAPEPPSTESLATLRLYVN